MYAPIRLSCLILVPLACLSVCQTVGRCPLEKFTDIIILSPRITFVALVQTGLYPNVMA